MNDKKEYGIFNEVHFMNEGVAGAILGSFAVMYGIPLGMILIAGGISLLSNAHVRSKIKKALKNAVKEDKDIEKFDEEMKVIRFINVNSLIKLISDKDKKMAKADSVSCAIIEGENKKLLAYAIKETDSNKYAFYIYDKSYRGSKKLEEYIKALFELKFGVIGDGIRTFVSEKELKDNASMYNPSNSKNRTSQIYMSNEEFSKTIKFTFKLYDEILSKLKSKFNGNEYSIDYSKNKTSGVIYLTNDGSEYDPDTEIDDIFDKEYVKFRSSINSILTKCGYDLPDNMEGYDPIKLTSEKDDYNMIKVNIEPFDDGELGWYIVIYTNAKN